MLIWFTFVSDIFCFGVDVTIEAGIVSERERSGFEENRHVRELHTTLRGQGLKGYDDYGVDDDDDTVNYDNNDYDGDNDCNDYGNDNSDDDNDDDYDIG